MNRLLLLSLIQLSSAFCGVMHPLLKIATECKQMAWTPELLEACEQWYPQNEKPGVWHTAHRPLLDAYPMLRNALPWLALADLPTPITQLKRLGGHLQVPQLYLKNDGLTAQPVGGNKVRKLELLFGDALFKNAYHIITFGCAGSNHAAATAYHAHRCNLQASLLLGNQVPSPTVKNNLLVDRYSKASLIPCGKLKYKTVRQISAMHTFLQATQQDGQFPYVIPTGASCPLGSIGYVNAIFELAQQIKEGTMPEPDYIYCAIGSLGTAAGMLVGLKATGLKAQLVGVGVEGNEHFAADAIELAQKTNALLHEKDSSFPVFDYAETDLTINMQFARSGYGVLVPEVADAITLCKAQEHLTLERTYSGKTAAALISDVKNNPTLQNAVILFWNTFGIQKIKCSTDDYKQLPRGLHHHFEMEEM